MARTPLLALLAAFVLAGGIATAIVRVGDDAPDTTDVAVEETTDDATEADVAPPAGSDDVADPAPDPTQSAINAADSGVYDDLPQPAINAVQSGVYDDLPAATDSAADDAAVDGNDEDSAVAIDSLPNTGGGLPALLGAGVALGAVATGRRNRR